MQKILIDKDFDLYYDNVLKNINSDKDSLNRGVSMDNFISKVSDLNFCEVKKYMQLIDSNKMSSIFFARDIEFDGNIVSGKDVWSNYKDLLIDKTLGYAEKQVKLSNLREKIDLFTYQVYDFKNITDYNDEIGGLKYIEEGDLYFTDGKFDREKYSVELNSSYNIY